jgi:o-succinylbenzoate---CoA ligase
VIDWSTSETHLLLNPRMPAADRERAQSLFDASPALRRHIWIATSGTTGSIKLTALAKDAFLSSAAAVNEHLEASSHDVWCCVLPTFHVGGLSIYARAALTDAHVIAFDWDARRYARQRFTLSALVPAQLRDLVRASLRPAASVRAVVIGGGALPRDLYDSARALGWPVLPSYGMTECCSQVATAGLDSADMRILNHIDVRVTEDGRLAFRGPSLLTGYATDAGFIDPKQNGWFHSEDAGEVEGRTLRVLGRRGDFVKIGGESVDLGRLDAILDGLRGSIDAAVFAAADERLGSVIQLAAADGDVEELVDAFNERVFPFERIRAVRRVSRIPRTALGKLLRRELTNEVG